MRERSLVAIQQGNPKERIKHKIVSVDSGYRDKEIGIKGIQYTSILLSTIINLEK